MGASNLIADGLGFGANISHIVRLGLDSNGISVALSRIITEGFGSFSNTKYVVVSGFSLGSGGSGGLNAWGILARRRRR